MKRRIKRRPNGFSMLEVLTASAILVLGLTGIVVMLNNIAGHTRDGTSSINGTVIANQSIQEFQALGYDGLAAQVTTDAGYALDYAGRKFGQEVTVTAFVSDGGIPSYQIEVAVSWRDMIGKTHRNVATTVVSKAPDAG